MPLKRARKYYFEKNANNKNPIAEIAEIHKLAIWKIACVAFVHYLFSFYILSSLPYLIRMHKQILAFATTNSNVKPKKWKDK